MPDLVFADAETRSLCELTTAGGYKYARHASTDVLVWGFAFDDELPQVWSPAWAWGNTDCSRADVEPTALLDHIENKGYFVAWNANFDRNIWNNVMVPRYGWPHLRLSQVLCAQAQAEGNNLPGKLDKACEALRTSHKKDPAGNRLIQQLSIGDKSTWDSNAFETPGKMGHFRVYCAGDLTSMRDVWQSVRPLTADEWDEYHASERINDRGVSVDANFAVAARRYALHEAADINGQMAELTGDPVITITNHVRKARWLHDELWPNEELQALTKRPPKDGKERFSCDRPTREAVLDVLADPEHSALFEDDHLDRVVNFLELIEAGNSAAVNKFTAISNQQVDGRLYGGYSFNGAGQTGRFSSRGVQRHNMIRAPLDEENADRACDAIDDIIDGVPAVDLVEKYRFPMSRLLARLIRPTFIAPEGKQLVWGDWDQIEARVLPWLSDTPGGDMKLDLFRQKQDVYKHAAAPIFGVAPDDVDKHQRQVGKVAELALGFGGAAGAFGAMARGYGVVIPGSLVSQTVTTWRKQNDWCVRFWHQLWQAAMDAFNTPGNWFTAGRVKYLFHPTVMHGTLICALPCGRWLVYPQFKHERAIVKEKDKHTGQEVERIRWRTSFVKGFAGGFGRVDLWYGVLAENITQGTAASFLRDALVECDAVGLPVVLHTHDEIVAECSVADVPYLSADLQEIMEYIPEWGEGLPLTVSVEDGPFYTK